MEQGAKQRVFYLDVGCEEGELQRPAVLHAAGDHACEEQPHQADLRLPAAGGDLVVGHRPDR